MPQCTSTAVKVVVCVTNNSRRDREGGKLSENKTGKSECPDRAGGSRVGRDCREGFPETADRVDGVWFVSRAVILGVTVAVYPCAAARF